MNDKEKLHYRYMIAFLVWTGLLLFSFFYGKNGNEVVSYIGFAGTLSSIILAVAALIYAFYQNSIYGSSNEKLDTSAKRIESVTSSLDRTNEQVSLRLNETVAELRDSLEQTINHMNTGFKQISSSLQEQLDQNAIMNTSLEQVRETVMETKYNLYFALGNFNSVKTEELSTNELNNFILNYVQFQSIHQIIFLYYFIELKKIDKEGNVYNFIIWALNKKIAMDSDVFHEEDDSVKTMVLNKNIGLFWGLYYQTTYSGILEIEGDLSKTIIKSINSDLERAVINRIDLSGIIDQDLHSSLMDMMQNEI
ncbi:hypothetical protein [Cohnella abietis]|uniref:Uncharacterized protein n=1 Tax=Cohnella abietis TaxID=2507935 RepID=A0A3T1D3I4_9BACL|nr:hypothetical protein [Cohnella abietis]BBI32673.1 hypothetical protein KCTCHS21_20720 [Cohnella abietis]